MHTKIVINCVKFLLVGALFSSQLVAGVVAYYTFDNHTRDATANKYDGQASNVTYSTDVPAGFESGSRSLYWGNESVPRYVDLPVIRGLGEKFTVSCWVKVPSGNTDAGWLPIVVNNPASNPFFGLVVNTWGATNRRLSFETKDANMIVDAAFSQDNAFSFGTWHHVAYVRNGGTATIYLDGTAVPMLNTSINDDFPIDLALRIGNNKQVAIINWKGWIDDFAVWDEAVSSETVQSLANCTKTPANFFEKQAQVVAYYTFDYTATDSSGLGYHMLSRSGVYYNNQVPSEIGNGYSLVWPNNTSIARFCTIPAIKEINSTFTITCWLQPNGLYTNTAAASSIFSSEVPQKPGLNLYMNTWNSDNRRLVVQTRDAVSAKNTNTTFALTKGIWQHVAYVFDQDELRIYVDGVLVKMDAGHKEFPREQLLRIGHNWQATGNTNWVGNMDDFAIWNGTLSENIIRNLANGDDSPANHVVPASWLSTYVDEMDGFYRYGTMNDRWLRDGGGLETVPDWWINNSSSFPYQNRNSDSEGIFVDHWFLNRSLGGWNSGWEGSGEFDDQTNRQDYDIAYKNGNDFEYDWEMLFARIDPYIDEGYLPTIVIDGVPWAFSTVTPPQEESYGNHSAPDDNLMGEWFDFIEEMGSQLVSEYGVSSVTKMRFRVSTELRSRYIWSNTNQFLKFYDYTSEALNAGLPEYSQIGMFNYAASLDGDIDLEDVADHWGHGTNFKTGQTGSITQWFARGFYLNHVSDQGGPYVPYRKDPFVEVPKFVQEMETLEGESGKVLPWEVHEMGILNNEFGQTTAEPGAFGSAWTFSMLGLLYEDGFNTVQHWNLYEKLNGSEMLPYGQAWVMMVLDHLRGGDYFTLSRPAKSQLGTQYYASAVKTDNQQYILISAFNTNRLVSDPRNITLSIPRDMISIADTSTLKCVELTYGTSLYDIIREDLDTLNLLSQNWSAHSKIVGTVDAMDGEEQGTDPGAGEQYVLNNITNYRNAFIDSLTLSEFSGSVTTNTTSHQLTLNISAPTVMVIVIE